MEAVTLSEGVMLSLREYDVVKEYDDDCVVDNVVVPLRIDSVTSSEGVREPENDGVRDHVGVTEDVSVKVIDDDPVRDNDTSVELLGEIELDFDSVGSDVLVTVDELENDDDAVVDTDDSREMESRVFVRLTDVDLLVVLVNVGE